MMRIVPGIEMEITTATMRIYTPTCICIPIGPCTPMDGIIRLLVVRELQG
jgi:hypothetical protein